ncbi:hypothetical protein AYO47_00220 [Planctomyces sp. SCGC AG-212-M04]|nr:hypothetical protein AYO47_00220 [Planctomyces sp. SCGC AG-212-M04]
MVVAVAVLAVGLCWWLCPVRDRVDYLQLMLIGVAAYATGRYLVMTTNELTRTLRCKKCGSDALQAGSEAEVPKFGFAAFFLCRSCRTRWAYNPFTKKWADASDAEYDRRFPVGNK